MIKSAEFRSAAVQADLLKFVPDEIRASAVIFAGGSLVHDYGNPTSDIDIIAVHREATVDGRAESTRSVVKVGEGLDVHIGEYRGVRVDLEIVRWATISSTAAKLRDGGSSPAVPEFLRVTLNNLKNGVPFTRYNEFELLRDSFPWSTYTRAVALDNASKFQSTAEDASGGILGGDIGPAMLASKRALDNATDALLAARGNTNFRTKWRLRMLEKFVGSESARCYLNAQLEPSLEVTEVIQRAKNRLRIGQSFLAEAHSALNAETRSRDAVALARPRRSVDIPGHPNAWDMGGLPIGDSFVKFGVLFRAGSAKAVKAEHLRKHGIVTVIDLKTDEEAHFPIRGSEGKSIKYVALPYRTFSMEAVVEIVRLIEQTDGAVLIHCARGRDRTGLVVASLLLLLGASTESVTADFMNSVRGWDAVAPEHERATRAHSQIESGFRSMLRQSEVAKLAGDAGLTQETLEAVRRKILTHATSPAVVQPGSFGAIFETIGTRTEEGAE